MNTEKSNNIVLDSIGKIDSIKRAVAYYYGYQMSDYELKTRQMDYVRLRHVAIYFVYNKF